MYTAIVYMQSNVATSYVYIAIYYTKLVREEGLRVRLITRITIIVSNTYSHINR